MTDTQPNPMFPDGGAEWMNAMVACKRIPSDAKHGGLWLTVIPLLGGRSRVSVAEPGINGNASVEHW